MGPVSLQTESPILPPNEAFEAGGDAPTNDECEGMDVDTPVAAEEVGGEEDVVETQDDSLSLPGMDSPRIEVERLTMMPSHHILRYRNRSSYLYM